MTRFLLSLICMAVLAACNNDNKTATTTDSPAAKPPSTPPPNVKMTPASGSASVKYTVDNTDKKTSGSVLVQKDKSKLSPGNDYFAIVTSNGPNGETFVLNFLFSLKTGSYPVVGLSYSRDLVSDKGEKKGEVFGGLLGGKPKKTNYTVNITKMEDLGSNNVGGHKWKMSGTIEQEEVTIDAMGLMKMDKEHPASIKVNKISFENLSFDDNWDEMMEETMKKVKLK